MLAPTELTKNLARRRQIAWFADQPVTERHQSVAAEHDRRRMNVRRRARFRDRIYQHQFTWRKMFARQLLHSGRSDLKNIAGSRKQIASAGRL